VGAFRFLKDDPPFREVAVPLVPSKLGQATWDPAYRSACTQGRSSYLAFDLGEVRSVDGIRIKYRCSNLTGVAPCTTLSWKRGEADRSPGQWRMNGPTGDRATWEKGTMLRLGDPQTSLTNYICDSLSLIVIQPDLGPGIFEFDELVLLLHDAG
jgi:hypothetical protein